MPFSMLTVMAIVPIVLFLAEKVSVKRKNLERRKDVHDSRSLIASKFGDPDSPQKIYLRKFVNLHNLQSQFIFKDTLHNCLDRGDFTPKK